MWAITRLLILITRKTGFQEMNLNILTSVIFYLLLPCYPVIQTTHVKNWKELFLNLGQD